MTLFLAVFSQAAFAGQNVKETNTVSGRNSYVVNQPITIAINATSFPYHSIDEQSKAIGLMPELWRLWAKKQQVKIKFVVLP